MKNQTISSSAVEQSELVYYPIFRDNELYQAMFPEIKPLFAVGEEVGQDSVKKLIDEIILHENDKLIILDETCKRVLKLAKEEDFPKKINTSCYDSSIDWKIEKHLHHEFSPGFAKTLFEKAKGKNKNVKQIYIVMQNLSDHSGSFRKLDELPFFNEHLDSAKKILGEIENEYKCSNNGREYEHEEKLQTALNLSILRKAAEDEFGITPKFVMDIKPGYINDGDHIVVDRHNRLIGEFKIHTIIPNQISQLPLGTELFNYECFSSDSQISNSVAKELRKLFEKK